MPTSHTRVPGLETPHCFLLCASWKSACDGSSGWVLSSTMETWLKFPSPSIHYSPAPAIANFYLASKQKHACFLLLARSLTLCFSNKFNLLLLIFFRNPTILILQYLSSSQGTTEPQDAPKKPLSKTFCSCLVWLSLKWHYYFSTIKKYFWSVFSVSGLIHAKTIISRGWQDRRWTCKETSSLSLLLRSVDPQHETQGMRRI